MKAVWSSEKPLTSSEIISMVEVAEKSYLTIISNLLKKGYLKIVGNVKVGKTVNRLYAPSIELSEYVAMQMNSIYRDNKNGFDFKSVISNFVNSNKRTDKEKLIKNLHELVDSFDDITNTDI